MNGYDETTLPRAVAAYGPYRIEYRVLRRVGELNDKTGELQGFLAQLLDGEPVPMTWVSGRIAGAQIALIDLYAELTLLAELLGEHPCADAHNMVITYENILRGLEKDVKKIEHDRACRYGAPAGPAPDTYQYDKREVLDMVCTMAAREAAEKEGKPNEQPV